MKNLRTGRYLMWKGEPAKIIGWTDEKLIVIESLETKKCPHCKGDLGKKVEYVIINSNLFRENADALPTIG